MSKLWLLVVGGYDGSLNFSPIMANSKKDVGKYIRNNIEKVMFMFETLYYCNDNYGKIREKLNDWYDDPSDDEDGYFLEMIKNDYESVDFIESIKTIFNGMTDSEIVDEFWGYNKDRESCFVTIQKTSAANIVNLNDNE